MKVVQVGLAQALRFVSVKAHVYLPDTIAALRQRYGFVRVPQTADEMLAPLSVQPQPLTFSHGKMSAEGRDIIINQLQIYPQLVMVDAATSTDDADVVLDDLLSQNEAVLEESKQRRAYISQLVIELDVALDEISQIATPMGTAITQLLSGYLDAEAPSPPLRISSLSMTNDPTERVLPCDFRIERRIKEPFTSNLYFSQAPLRTRDHETALKLYEQCVRDVIAARG